MDKMEFYNKLFIDTMEKYMKARGVNIKEADLVAAACDYCDHQKVHFVFSLEQIPPFLSKTHFIICI